MTVVVIAFNSTACATAESTTSSLIGCLVRHVAADASKTREVNTGASTGEGKNAPITGSALWGEPVRGVCTDQRCSKCSPGVSDSLGVPVRPVGVYVGGMVLCNSRRVRATRIVMQSRSLQGAAVKANASCVHSSGDRRL